MDELAQDLRYALRQIAGAPLLSTVTFLVLTLGIGANAVVLSVLEGVFFRPPPGVGESEGLVEIRSTSTSDQRTTPLTYREFLAVRDQDAAFEEVAAYNERMRVALRTDGGTPEMVLAELASSGYFTALDVGMELGTGFVPGDDRRAEGAAHAVLGYGFWQRRLGGSPDVVGRRIDVNGRPYTVLGVAPERFYGVGGGDDPVAVWLPAVDHPLLFPEGESLLGNDQARFQAVARLADGVTIARAEAVARSAAREVHASIPDVTPGDRRMVLTPYRGVGSRLMSDALGIVGGVGAIVAGLVLLIACANASGLLVGRALGRRREMGVRLAVGAGRRRIIRQLLTESLLLAGVAGTAGVLLTFWTLDILERTLFTFPLDLAPSFTVLAMTTGVAAATGVAFGLTPALHATDASVYTALKDDVAGSSRRTSRLREGFTVAQLALCLPLLTAAGLMVLQLGNIDAGWGFDDPDGILAIRIDLRHSGYGSGEIEPLLSEISDRLSPLPGIASTTFAKGPPFGLPSHRAIPRSLPGEDRFETWRRGLWVALVDPDYFAMMGIPILRGRPIDSDDVAGAPLVAVVDEEAARRRWPDEEPLGKTLFLGEGDEQRPITVVGVARTVLAGTGRASSLAYGARRQLPDTSSVTLLVRARDGSAASLAPAVRGTLRAVDPDLVLNISLLSEELHNPEMTHGSAGTVACGLLALLLACVGLYGMIATGVTERTREIGVRIALGADRGRVIRHFVGRGLRVTLIALGVGLPLSWITISVVGARVVGVGAFAREVAIGLAAVTVLMLAVGGLSSWLPARRSSGVDPVLALRSE